MFEEDFTAVRMFTPIIQLDPHLRGSQGGEWACHFPGGGASSGVDSQIHGGAGTRTKAHALVLMPPQQTCQEPEPSLCHLSPLIAPGVTCCPEPRVSMPRFLMDCHFSCCHTCVYVLFCTDFLKRRDFAEVLRGLLL